MRAVTVPASRLRMFFCSAAVVLAAPSLPLSAALAAEQEPRETLTLMGEPVRPLVLPDDVLERLELDLEVARAAFDAAPDREDSYIWLGRRLGYLGRFEEAVAVFTAGLQKFPDSYKLYRFRGRHRARSRDFEGAVADYLAGLEKMDGVADTFEPDGAPNARGLTIGTYRANLHYYLGQTSFATGDYARMVEQLDRSNGSPIALAIEDHKVAVAFWKHIALMKLGEPHGAKSVIMAVPEELDLVENHFYHRAVKVLQGRIGEKEALEGDSLMRFALGVKKRFEGDERSARRILEAIISDTPLGYWPAEVELRSME